MIKTDKPEACPPCTQPVQYTMACFFFRFANTFAKGANLVSKTRILLFLSSQFLSPVQVLVRRMAYHGVGFRQTYEKETCLVV